jgi:hypothetical protein
MQATASKYQVIVGNVGTTYDGPSRILATAGYGEYKRQSQQGYGRVAGESVTLMRDGEPMWEHAGSRELAEV